MRIYVLIHHNLRYEICRLALSSPDCKLDKNLGIKCVMYSNATDKKWLNKVIILFYLATKSILVAS